MRRPASAGASILQPPPCRVILPSCNCCLLSQRVAGPLVSLPSSLSMLSLWSLSGFPSCVLHGCLLECFFIPKHSHRSATSPAPLPCTSACCFFLRLHIRFLSMEAAASSPGVLTTFRPSSSRARARLVLVWRDQITGLQAGHRGFILLLPPLRCYGLYALSSHEL